ncbi:MAG: SPOR domain-containing protein [Treponema sp.]|nr:SPOR domain-containing protein [Candidatus Treponema equifaecale]
MEQKRTLWIVAAAGIFLLVVVGAALIIYSPSLHNTPVQQASYDPATGWVNSGAAPATPAPDAFAEKSEPARSPYDPLAQNSQPAEIAKQTASEFGTGAEGTTIQAQNVTVYAQETTTFDLNALKASNYSSNNVAAQNQVTENQIAASKPAATSYSEPAPSKAQDSYYAPAPVKKEAPKPAATTAKPAATKTTTAAAKPASTSTKTATATKVATAAKKTNDLFWVQVAAYTSKKNADDARSVLEANKIPVEVFTDSKYFRVRVGPYQTKSEAAYWQKMVSEIGKFADTKTMIVNSAVQK